MTFYGTFKNGVVVLEDPVCLPEGTRVTCETPDAVSTPTETRPKRHAGLLALAGSVDDDRTDGSVNHDHYLYGHPKR